MSTPQLVGRGINPTPMTFTADDADMEMLCVKCGKVIGVKPKTRDGKLTRWIRSAVEYWQWCAPCADADRKQRASAPNRAINQKDNT